MIKVEICIACDELGAMEADVAAACEGGAATVELCSRMDVGGLTPGIDFIRAARAAFTREGVMVMIRPRAGGFAYSLDEILTMQRQIHRAAEAGADGVVMGILDADGQLAHAPLAELVALAHSQGLKASLHRAFDDASNPFKALETAIKLGCDRILTAGTPYQADLPAVAGIAQLHDLILRADNRIEIVIGGGVNAENAGLILQDARPAEKLAVHAFSGVRVGAAVDAERVCALHRAANAAILR
ncbi:MAG: hypothetical protein JXA97_10005 [Anaerolineales bacterium]|nr:hypothetical protein [Anaerolineales bacterium]